MQFKDVIGQNEIKAQLVKEVDSGRIPHAQLFLSRKGTGGLPMAMAFAQYLMCEQRADGDSCGSCPSCSKVSQLIHPDLHYCYPSFRKRSDKPNVSTDFIKEWREANAEQPYMNTYDWLQFLNADNKQGNISAEECRSIIKRLQLKSFEGAYKIQIIWMAEALGKEGNILLKLLEEPPEDTILILIAEQQEAILNTILSRTQVKTFIDLPTDDIKNALIKKASVEEEKASKIAFLADGDYHKALSLIDQNTTAVFDWLEVWLAATMNRKAVDLMKFITTINKQGRETIKQFFDYILHFFRECLALQFKSETEVKLTSREKNLAKRIWQIANLDRLSRLIPLIEEKHYHIERNVNAKHVLLDLSIQAEKILRGKI